jgi:hypothetical protein
VAEWRATENGVASEGGIVVRDEEYWEDGPHARISVERDCRSAPAAITCGLYGWMVHTRFFGSLTEAETAAEEMKPELVGLVHHVQSGEVRDEAFEAFVDRFPT